jgi:flagellar hook-associated protein 3 FlgL
MRITNAMRVADFLRYVEDRTSNMYNLQTQIASGYRLHRPSDDPVGVHQTLLLTEQISQNEQYTRNLENGLSRLSYTDNVMMEINDLIVDLSTLALEADNGDKSEEDLENMAIEAEQIIQQLVSLANSQYNGVYIFAGQWTQTMPFEDSQEPGGVTTEVILALDPPLGDILRQIGPGDLVPINVAGDELFMPDGAGEMTDLFWVAIAIRDTMNNNNQPPPGNESTHQLPLLRDALEDIRERVAGFQATTGALVDRMNNVNDQLLSTNLTLTDSLSNIADTDMVNAAMNLQLDQVAYQATLNVGSMVLQPSLLDYITT